MAAHVVVLDSTARSAKIKTTPGKHLTDIIEEACAKLGRDANLYGLKHKNKILDLSRTVMLSGLSPGAKLELVAASKSPSVVSVALQLPQAELNGSARLTDKFPSTTTIWLILRKFESSSGSGRNFTARSTPVNDRGISGAGRLFFETPVVTAMNRELTSFTDLQKTLAQIGVNSGSILLRLSFRKTDRPLEEAMMEIDQYFKYPEQKESIELQGEVIKNAGSDPLLENQVSAVESVAPSLPESDLDVSVLINGEQDSNRAQTGEHAILTGGLNTKDPERPAKTVTGPSERPITIFAPPSSTVPKAALQKENDDAFEPTIDHLKSHQRYLQMNSQNKPLKSDAQLAAEAESMAEKIAQTKDVEIKLRFPDQSQVSASFSNADTARTLYNHARGLMRNPDEPISLTFPGSKGRQVVPLGSDVNLISGLGLVGRVLVEVAWSDTASLEARQTPILKDEYQAKAQAILVKLTEGEVVEVNQESPKTEDKGAEKQTKKSGMPKWFKGIGKK